MAHHQTKLTVAEEEVLRWIDARNTAQENGDQAKIDGANEKIAYYRLRVRELGGNPDMCDGTDVSGEGDLGEQVESADMVGFDGDNEPVTTQTPDNVQPAPSNPEKPKSSIRVKRKGK